MKNLKTNQLVALVSLGIMTFAMRYVFAEYCTDASGDDGASFSHSSGATIGPGGTINRCHPSLDVYVGYPGTGPPTSRNKALGLFILRAMERRSGSMRVPRPT